MNKKIVLIITAVLLATLLWVGSVNAQEGDDDGYPIETPPASELNLACDGTRVHPALNGLAVRFNVPYEEVLLYFCDLEMGVGEIKLLLQTVLLTGEETSLEELLAQRVDEGLGWGEIWQSLGLIGNGRNGADDPDNIDDEGLVEKKTRNTFLSQNEIKEKNENRPDTPPGLNGENNGNKPATPPGQNKDKSKKNPNRPDTP